MILTISGKMFSGKDTLADLLAPTLRQPVHRFTFSDLIRSEGNVGLETIRRTHGAPRERVVAAVAEDMRLSAEHAEDYLSAVVGEVADPDFSMHRRTDSTRFVLQSLGSHWRPENYWAHIVFDHAREEEASGKVVIMVGARFPAEHDMFGSHGALRVRLDVSRPVQVERALKRDGVIPTEEQFMHYGEVALDDAEFGLRIDTDDRTPEQVCALTQDWLRTV